MFLVADFYATAIKRVAGCLVLGSEAITHEKTIEKL